MKIRSALPPDWTILKALNQKLFDLEYHNFDSSIDPEWPSSKPGINYYKDVISNTSKATFIAEDEGKAIGYIVVSYETTRHDGSYRKNIRDAEIENMFIEIDFRGRGIGHQLVLQAEQWAKNRGATHMQVVSSFTNSAASDFYTNTGFKIYSVTHEKKIL